MSVLPDRWPEEEDQAAQEQPPAPPHPDQDQPPATQAGRAEDAAPAPAGEGDSPRPDTLEDGDPTAEEVPAAAAADDPGQAPLPADHPEWELAIRLAEALVFASDRPVTVQRLAALLPEDLPAVPVLQELAARCQGRGVQLVEVAGGWAFRTAPDLAPRLTKVVELPRRLPRAAMEALSIIAYHQPCTRAEIEDIRGASLAQSSLEALLELGLIAPRGKKEVPGRPTLWGTTPKFLDQFGLKSLSDLPKREELVTAETAPALPLPPVGSGPAPRPEAAAPEAVPPGAALQAAELPGEAEAAGSEPPGAAPQATALPGAEEPAEDEVPLEKDGPADIAADSADPHEKPA